MPRDVDLIKRSGEHNIQPVVLAEVSGASNFGFQPFIRSIVRNKCLFLDRVIAVAVIHIRYADTAFMRAAVHVSVDQKLHIAVIFNLQNTDIMLVKDTAQIRIVCIHEAVNIGDRVLAVISVQPAVHHIGERFLFRALGNLGRHPDTQFNPALLQIHVLRVRHLHGSTSKLQKMIAVCAFIDSVILMAVQKKRFLIRVLRCNTKQNASSDGIRSIRSFRNLENRRDRIADSHAAPHIKRQTAVDINVRVILRCRAILRLHIGSQKLFVLGNRPLMQPAHKSDRLRVCIIAFVTVPVAGIIPDVLLLSR